MHRDVRPRRAAGDRAPVPVRTPAASPVQHSRTLIKVCGLTRLEDARAALDAGADWLGFIVHGDSPRRITPERAAEITAALPGATAVAVMVAVAPAEALDLARRAGAQRVQIHRAPPGWPAEFPLPAAIVVPVTHDGRLMMAAPASRHLLMLDTADAGRAGGTGRTFPWEGAVAVARERAVLLAGGLGPENVAAAIACVRPFGVDASSQLESAPGIKDHARVRDFIAAVREIDRREREPRA